MNALWVADDVDDGWEKEFEVVQDRLTKELDTIRTELNNIKIYADAFLQESMPGSQRYPEARQKLFREVENGALLVSYVGHGGEVGWATERILQLEDINAWENQTTMPVFTTITCEFARFDDPNRVSAAEQLHLNPNGGAIALFSTTRSVFATNSTYQLNELLNRNMLFLDQPRLGDVIRTTKNNNISGDKIKFSLLGDAALPLARPENGLVFDSINGIAWDQFSDTIKALNWVQIKGSIRDDNGQILTNINGRVWLQFYDKAQNVQTKTNDNRGGAFNFTTQNNAVFKGQATVVNGAFTFEFRVPLDINLSVGPPKIAAYATNFERDFWGASRQHLIGGVYDGVITDTEGPEVRLYINDTTFVSGGF
ncbi:MAG: oxidoreductase, partial [Flavobacteriia bacterium]|nr:oxidoreductase [Flavobacteriia bacterium]